MSVIQECLQEIAAKVSNEGCDGFLINYSQDIKSPPKLGRKAATARAALLEFTEELERLMDEYDVEYS